MLLKISFCLPGFLYQYAAWWTLITVEEHKRTDWEPNPETRSRWISYEGKVCGCSQVTQGNQKLHASAGKGTLAPEPGSHQGHL